MNWYLFGVQVTHNTYHEIVCASKAESIEQAQKEVEAKFPDYTVVTGEKIEAPSALERMQFMINKIQIVSDKLGEYMEKRYLNNYDMF